VHDAISGDGSSWAELVDRFANLVWSIARGVGLGDADAADVSQTVWLRLAEHLSEIEHPERVGGWLATTTRRESIRVRRLSLRAVPTDDFDRLTEDGSAEGSAEARLLRAVRDGSLWHAFGRLSERDQALLLASVADRSCSYREISESLGMPIGSIGPTRARALATLRKFAEAEGLLSGDLMEH
jgi:RNA polymerase sigma factor (sigma-70 family)